jgi:hypothetical protein
MHRHLLLASRNVYPAWNERFAGLRNLSSPQKAAKAAIFFATKENL